MLPFSQTASAISIVVLAAALYPEAQAIVQDELDAIVGKDRGLCVCMMPYIVKSQGIWLVPSFGDQNILNQVTAFVLETYRWRPVSAGGTREPLNA